MNEAKKLLKEVRKDLKSLLKPRPRSEAEEIVRRVVEEITGFRITDFNEERVKRAVAIVKGRRR